MLADTVAFGFTVAEWVVIFGASLLALEVLGFSRSGRTARKDNEDLRQHNATLESEATKRDTELATRDAKIANLELKVAQLETEVAEVKQRDQGAVLAAISEHERSAGERHEKTHGVLVEIRDAVRVNQPEGSTA